MESEFTPPSLQITKTRILIVDDNPYVCKAIQRIVMSEGYQCEISTHGEDALLKMHEFDFDLVISDLMMPGLSGLDLLSRIKERFPNTAVLIVTGVDDRKAAIKALRRGAYGYIVKPFEKNELLINVANALERRRLFLESLEYERRLEHEVRVKTAEVRQREEEIALRLVGASEYRDEETGAHIRRLGLYAATLAEHLGWKASQVDYIRVAAPMHDVGKIGIPDKILLKPGALSTDEYKFMQTHTTIGSKILGGSNIPLLQMATDIALYHHEKWNGTGYPNKISAQEIPEAARIVAVADVYDALINDRVYRPAFSEDKTLAIMADSCGSHFDPKIYDCFMSILPTFRQILLEHSEKNSPPSPLLSDYP
jgi:putative two-component system response regulator